jgi:hypothetical protein
MAVATTISSYKFGYVDSANADTAYYEANIKLDSASNATRCAFMEFKLPTLKELSATDKTYVNSITIALTVATAGSGFIEMYKLKDKNKDNEDYKLNFEYLTYGGYDQQGTHASSHTWEPANWQQEHISASDVPVVEGNVLHKTLSSLGTRTCTININEYPETGWDFGSTCRLAFYAGSDESSDIIITQDNVVITLNTLVREPEPATIQAQASNIGTTADFTVSIPEDKTINEYYFNTSSSENVAAVASGSKEYRRYFINNTTETVPQSFTTISFTQGANLFVGVFTENVDNAETNATKGTEVKIFRPAINTAVLYSDSGLTSALAAGAENVTIGQKVYLKVVNSNVATADTKNKFTKIRVNWDSGTSDTDEDYAIYDMQDLTPVANNSSNTVVSHVYSTGGAKVVKVQVEDENGFRSDKGNITGEQPNVKYGFPSAVISPSVTKVTQAKYGDRTTALTLSGQHSRTSGADITINQYLWGYVPSLTSTTIVTSNALENDNTVFDDGSHRVKIGALSRFDVSDTVFKIFGLASFDSSGDSVSDTSATFDHYAFVSATASPSYDIDARPNYGSLAVSGSDEIYFKEIECVVCITKDATENNGISDCKRYLLATNGGDIINKDLFYDSNVTNSIVDIGQNINEDLDTTEEVITLTSAAATSGDIIKIDSELMFVKATTGADILVERGYNNTTAATHTNGTDVYVYRVATRYKWGGYAMIRGTASGYIDFDSTGKITIQNIDSDYSSSSTFTDWFENNFFVGDIIKIGNDSGSNGTYASPKYFKLKSFLRDSNGDGVEDGDNYNVAVIETDVNNLTDEERAYVSTSLTTDADESATIIRYDSSKKPSITCASFNSANAQDNTTFYLATIDSTDLRFDATDKGGTTDLYNFQYNWSETSTNVISVAPETLDLDTLADASDIAIEKINLTRSGGISSQMPLGIRRYPVGVTRTKLGVPKVAVQIKALSQTGYRALFSLVEGNRYDYVFLDSKKLDSPTTSYRTLRMRLESGNLAKDTLDPNVYLANLSFIILGEDVS